MNPRRDTTVQNLTITYSLVTLIVLAVIAYLYFLNLSVVQVIMRKEATQEVNYLRTEIAMLETAYIEAQHTIVSRMGTMDHFTIDAEKIFVHRGQTSLVLRDN